MEIELKKRLDTLKKHLGNHYLEIEPFTNMIQNAMKDYATNQGQSLPKGIVSVPSGKFCECAWPDLNGAKTMCFSCNYPPNPEEYQQNSH